MTLLAALNNSTYNEQSLIKSLTRLTAKLEETKASKRACKGNNP